MAHNRSEMACHDPPVLLLVCLMRTTVRPACFVLIACACMAADGATEIILAAKDAKVEGPAAYQSFANAVGWNNTNAVVSWTVQLPAKGAYRVFLTYATPHAQATNDFAELSLGNQKAVFEIEPTQGWHDQVEHDIGPLLVRSTGSAELTVRLTKVVRAKVWNLRAIRLVKED